MNDGFSECNSITAGEGADEDDSDGEDDGSEENDGARDDKDNGAGENEALVKKMVVMSDGTDKDDGAVETEDDSSSEDAGAVVNSRAKHLQLSVSTGKREEKCEDVDEEEVKTVVNLRW